MPTPAPFDRQQALEQMSRRPRFDVLVIGGGITGCGVALDAAARGLQTALVERSDFASGTSSKSSKLVHGGLRYLQQREYRLVYESLHERQRLLDNASHLVHPLPFLIPLFGRGGVVSKTVAKAYSTALWLYDATGGVRIGKWHQRVDAADALAHFPDLRTDRLAAAFLYWDAQVDDARLTLAVARTAAAYGAVLANYATVTELMEADGRVAGARLADGTEVRARVVVNATGVWTEEVARLASLKGAAHLPIRPAKGIHVVVPADRLPCDYASVLVVPGDRRSIFVVPWAANELGGLPSGPGRYTYVGTTDTDYTGALDDPECRAEDVQYLLDAINAWTTADLRLADVTGAWAGLRPLVNGARSARTADLSRRHAISASPAGLVTVTGGKLTTYRRMAEDTVNLVAADLGARRVRRSPTRRIRLVGARPPATPAGRSGAGAVAGAQLPSPIRRHLEGRHGSEAGDVVALASADSSLLTPLVPGLPYLRIEAVWAARREMARTLTDVLARRTRCLILDRRATAAAAPDVADLLATELGWDAAERRRQLADLERVIDAERRALVPQPDDVTSAAAAP
jgi:glycerol-3-phosphate dehydrogenase